MKATVKAKKQPARGITVKKGTAIQRVAVELVTIKLPQSVALALGHREGKTIEIASACVWRDGEEHRIAQWSRAHRLSGETHQAKKKDLEEILLLDLDTTVTVMIEADDWPRIKRVAEAAGTTPCDWLLASAWYNAKLETAAA
ncbi:MAG: hypothetical protein V4819_01515 [Verrucomicrobiota bacterium]